MEKISEINKWINSKLLEEIEQNDYAFTKSFGFIQMLDGRKAQVNLTLELDKAEWN